MSDRATFADDDAAWLAKLSLQDIQCMESRVDRLLCGEGLKPDSDLEPIVRSVVLQAIVDWGALESKLRTSTALGVDRTLVAAENCAQLDHLISHDLAQLESMVRVLDMASDRLGPLWHERLAPVLQALRDSSSRANGAAVARIFDLPRSGPTVAPETATFRKH